MKYKPGDKVRIKSFDWYNANKDEEGRVRCNFIYFCKDMMKYCGKELTIDFIYHDPDDDTKVYVMEELNIHWGFTDEMIEGLAGEFVDEPETNMVSLDKVCDTLYAMLSTQDINDYDYVVAPAYDNVVDFVEDFRKVFEK
jgi:hypothetical protein